MKTASSSGSTLRLAVTLLLITAVVAAALAGVNAITKDRIAAIRQDKVLLAITQVLPDGGGARQVTEFSDSTGLVTAVYESPAGFAVQVCPTGFGGAIDMMVGVGRDGKVLKIAVISHTETPGLGASVKDVGSKGQAFREQFIGMDGQLAVSKDGGVIDALTSATITSRAVTDGVNAALACADSLR